MLASQDADRRKHPHVRGEDEPSVNVQTAAAETPPRMWGRHFEFINLFRPAIQYTDFQTIFVSSPDAFNAVLSV